MLFTLLPDLNIAPLKYAHVHRDYGGPISSISFREREESGSKFFEAFAHLDKEKTGYEQASGFLYGDAHGFGTGITKAEAIYLAISEALERWAWRASLNEKSIHPDLRFDLDPSTTGFAAFPGLGLQGARKRAYFEAAERWSLCNWWEGRLEHAHLSLPHLSGISLRCPIVGVSIALLWEEGNLTAYGFAASHSIAAAAEKATIELRRNQEVLRLYQNAFKQSLGNLDLRERRLRFFAEREGAEIFKKRLSLKGTQSPLPSLLVDSAVMGPWSQYAHVWRCLFDSPPFRENDKDDYFLF